MILNANLYVQLFRIDLGRTSNEIGVGWNHPALEDQNGLDETCNASASLKMPDIRFNAASINPISGKHRKERRRNTCTKCHIHNQRTVLVPVPKGITKRIRFCNIPYGGSCAVALNVLGSGQRLPILLLEDVVSPPPYPSWPAPP